MKTTVTDQELREIKAYLDRLEARNAFSPSELLKAMRLAIRLANALIKERRQKTLFFNETKPEKEEIQCQQ